MDENNWQVSSLLSVQIQVKISADHKCPLAASPNCKTGACKTKLPATAAGKVFRKQNYLRMQAKISAGNDCLRFPRVTGGNLTAPAGNLRETFIVRVRADFFEPRDVSFYPVPNTLTKVATCCLWSQWYTLQTWFCSRKDGLFVVGFSIRYPKTYTEKFFTITNLLRNGLFFICFQSYRVKEKCQEKLRFGLNTARKHSAFYMKCNTADFLRIIGL